jgi:hypothetical protein
MADVAAGFERSRAAAVRGRDPVGNLLYSEQRLPIDIVQLRTIQPKTKALIVLGALAVCLALAALLHIYYLSDGGGGTLFYKGDEAYLFLGAGHIGYRFSYLEFPFVLIGEYFYRSPYTNDKNVSELVIRITPDSMERHFVHYGYGFETIYPLFLTPLDDGFYAVCQGGFVCKWTGSGFERAAEGRQPIDGVDHLAKGDMNNQVINGWNVRTIGALDAGDDFQVPLGRDVAISVKSLRSGAPNEVWPKRVTIELLRPNQPPEILYDRNAAQRKVNRKEYESAFRGR